MDVTKRLDKLEIREATLALEGLVDDLSRWYIRRSRRRFSAVAKGYGGQAEKEDYRNASVTLGFVIREIGKLIAPFNPFFAEVIYSQLGGKESIHLEKWPKAQVTKSETQTIKQMVEVRRLASLGLALRAEAGIKVRQPLRALKIRNRELGTKSSEFLAMLAEEVNVKEIVYDPKMNPPAGGDVELDTKITAELKEEGIIRELVRAVQDLRQKAGLEPGDKVVLAIETTKDLADVVLRNESLFKKEISAREIEYKKSAKIQSDLEMKIDNKDVWVGLHKV